MLEEQVSSSLSPKEQQVQPICLLNWNIQNPSLQRAQQQAKWILQTAANIVVLTEAKHSQGGHYLSDQLVSHGFTSFFQDEMHSDYAVLIAIKGFPSERLAHRVDFLPHRFVSAICETPLGPLTVIGLYVPSRGPKERRNSDKRRFQEQAAAFFSSPPAFGSSQVIVAGDLNVLERNHHPHYAVFGEWEYQFYESFQRQHLRDAYRWQHPDQQDYSWFGKTGNGYRFDHIFLSETLCPSLLHCDYAHSARSQGLSDHSGMILSLATQRLSPQRSEGDPQEHTQRIM